MLPRRITSSKVHEESLGKYGKRHRMSWRTIDIVTAAVLGVASGFILWIWNSIGGAGYALLDAVTPGWSGLVAGMWFVGGLLGGAIIRKPGAALFVEFLAACVSAALGSQWGIGALYSGCAQGLGVEIIMALCLYRFYGPCALSFAGMGAGWGAFIVELGTSANYLKSFSFNVTYCVCLTLSGAVIGCVTYFLVKALARTGALDRFPSGRSESFVCP